MQLYRKKKNMNNKKRGINKKQNDANDIRKKIYISEKTGCRLHYDMVPTMAENENYPQKKLLILVRLFSFKDSI